MKPYLLLAGWFLALLPTCSAQAPFGQYAASFPFGANRLLADPSRPRVYASVPSANTVAVIDVGTLSVVANVPVGTNPAAMAISRDGTTLYVLNADSGIDVVNLDTLQTSPSIKLPASGTDIAAGLNGQLYVSAPVPVGAVLQVDTVTDTVRVPPYSNAPSVRFLQISPDGRTLYGDDDALSSYDVSGSTPVFLQQSDYTQPVQGNSFTLSHDGKYLCAPGTENAGAVGYPTILYSTARIGGFYGTFDTGAFPGPCAFSADNSLLYQTRDAFGGEDQTSLELFDTNTFGLVASTPLPRVSISDTTSYNVKDVALDQTGSYLFVSHAPIYYDAPDTLVVVTTGRGTLSTPTRLPAISIAAASPTIPARAYAEGVYNLLRVGGNLSTKLRAFFTVTVTYVDGTRSLLATGKTKFAANRSTTTIKVELVPATMAHPAKGIPSKITVKLTPEATYTVSKTGRAKIQVGP